MLISVYNKNIIDESGDRGWQLRSHDNKIDKRHSRIEIK